MPLLRRFFLLEIKGGCSCIVLCTDLELQCNSNLHFQFLSNFFPYPSEWPPLILWYVYNWLNFLFSGIVIQSLL